MEQENLFTETSFQQDSNSQQPCQTLPDQNPSHIEATGMMIEDSSNMSISQLLKECQFKKALPLLQAEFDSKRGNLGDFDIKLVPLLNQMAEAQIALAQYSKAADLSHQSEQILQGHQEDPDYNPLIAHTYQIMALVSRENQDYKEALDLIQKSLGLSPSDSLENIEKHRVKALILCDLQYYKEALQEAQRSLDIAEKSINTTDHLLRARVYNTLGEIRWTFYDFHQAKIAYETAMEICRVNGLNFHVEMAKACEGFANSLIYTKKSSIAVLSHVWVALKIYDDCFGDDRHPARISSFLLLVRYFKPEQSLDVQVYAEKAVEEGEAFYGPDCEKIREIRLSAAKACGNHPVKEELLSPILEASAEGQNNQELANLYLQKCEASLLCGDFDFFKGIFREAVSTVQSVYGNISLEVAKLYEFIARVYQEEKKLKKATAYLEQCIKIYGEILGKNHIKIARSSFAISVICNTMKEFSQAALYDEQALKIRVDFHGKSHPAVIGTYIRLADAYGRIQEPLKSMKTYFEVLRIQEKIDDERLYETYESIGMLYSQQHDTKSAASYYRKSYQIARLKLGMSDERTLDTKEFSEFTAYDKDVLDNNQEGNIF